MQHDPVRSSGRPADERPTPPPRLDFHDGTRDVEEARAQTDQRRLL